MRNVVDDCILANKPVTRCFMGTRGPLSDAERDFVVSLAIRGQLATLEEGAVIAGVNRLTVLRWLQSAGVDWRAKRREFVGRLRFRCIAISKGRKQRRLTKAELRRIADAAKRTWDKAHAAELEKQGAANPGCEAPAQ